jgi:hypothetical protein
MQHGYTKLRSQAEGLTTEEYVSLGKLSEYHRGRAAGLRRALDVISKGMVEEAQLAKSKCEKNVRFSKMAEGQEAPP